MSLFFACISDEVLANYCMAVFLVLCIEFFLLMSRFCLVHIIIDK